MFAVVNHLPIREDADWSEISRRFNDFANGIKPSYPALRTAVVVKVGPGEAVFIGLYDDRATMEHVSANVAAPWFAENIRPFLSGPTARSVGEVIAGV
jgi:hypothetical protein